MKINDIRTPPSLTLSPLTLYLPKDQEELCTARHALHSAHTELASSMRIYKVMGLKCERVVSEHPSPLYHSKQTFSAVLVWYLGIVITRLPK
jgi:hypothetical protein